MLKDASVSVKDSTLKNLGNIIKADFKKHLCFVLFSTFWFQHMLGTVPCLLGSDLSLYSSALCFCGWCHGLPYAAPGPLSCVKVTRYVRGLVLRRPTSNNRGSEVLVKCWLPEFGWKTRRAFSLHPHRSLSPETNPQVTVVGTTSTE